MVTDNERTMEERLQQWGEYVAEQYIDENKDAIEAIVALGGPDEETMLEAVEWSNNVDRNGLLFLLAICVSEVVRRWGVEATNETLSSLLDEPSLAAIGDVVHAQQVVDSGGIPDRFVTEDLEAAIRAKIEESGDDVIVVDMNTGEVL